MSLNIMSTFGLAFIYFEIIILSYAESDGSSRLKNMCKYILQIVMTGKPSVCVGKIAHHSLKQSSMSFHLIKESPSLSR